MNVQEFLDIRPDALEPLWQIAQRNGMGFSTFIDTMVLTPSPSNNDVDGSQHHSFVVNFDYREAGQEDAERANGVGYYEYFSAIGGGEYSGNQYEGSGTYDAFVLDQPAYTKPVAL